MGTRSCAVCLISWTPTSFKDTVWRCVFHLNASTNSRIMPKASSPIRSCGVMSRYMHFGRTGGLCAVSRNDELKLVAVQVALRNSLLRPSSGLEHDIPGNIHYLMMTYRI